MSVLLYTTAVWDFCSTSSDCHILDGDGDDNNDDKFLVSRGWLTVITGCRACLFSSSGCPKSLKHNICLTCYTCFSASCSLSAWCKTRTTITGTSPFHTYLAYFLVELCCSLNSATWKVEAQSEYCTRLQQHLSDPASSWKHLETLRHEQSTCVAAAVPQTYPLAWHKPQAAR